MAPSYLYCTAADVKAKILGLDVSDVPASLLAHLEDKYIPWAQAEVDKYCGTNFDKTTVEEFYNGSGSSVLVLNHRPVREIQNVTLNLIPSAEWYQFKRPYYINVRDSVGIQIARQGGVEPINAALTTSDIPQEISYVYDEGLGFANESIVPSEQTAAFANTTIQYGRSDLFINASLGTIQIPPRILFLEMQAVPFFNYLWLRGVGNIRVRYTYGYSDPHQPDDLIDSEYGNLPKDITDATAALAAKYVLLDKGVFMGSGATSVSIDGVSKNYGDMPYGGLIKYLEETARRTLNRYKKLGV